MYINTPVRISENVLIIIYTDTVLIIFYSYLFSAYINYIHTPTYKYFRMGSVTVNSTYI